MDLSRNIIKRYVQVASPEKITSNSETVYGTVVNEGEELFVKIDGSNILTPVSSTIDIKANDRVLVLVKNHEATVIGSPSSPTARLEELKKLDDKITEFDTVIADKVGTGELVAIQASIDNLNANKLSVKDAELNYATIEKLDAENATINGKLTAYEASIEGLKADKIDASEVEAKYATIESLKATDAKFDTLDTTYAKITALDAQKARIDSLDANKLSAESADIRYAKIDFANIEQAAVEKVFSKSGIIEGLIVSDGKITGELVGVKIKGDLIETNTIQADKLVVKGSDGLYYKLNIEGGATTSEQVSDEDLQNGLSGSIIVAKSITANQIAVDDLVAFGATIGGFHIVGSSLSYGITEEDIDVINAHFDNLTSITAKYENMEAINSEIENLKARYANFDRVTEEDVVVLNADIENLRTAFTNATSISAEDLNVANSEIDNLKAYNANFTYLHLPGSIYSGAKSSVDNTTPGVYLDSDGKFSFGDSDNFIKFYEDQNGAYKLEISADSILFGSNKKSVENIEEDIDNVLEKTEYISVGTDNGKPYIELGEGDSDFKVKITNEEIQFNDGPTTPAYISNQKLMIEKAQVDNELRFGNFVWKERKNGNMGLTWEEVSS